MNSPIKKNSVPSDQGRQHLERTLENLRDPLDSKDARLLDIVRDLLQAHSKLESKYWPALAAFLERLEKGLPIKRVTRDFHDAYRQANPGNEIPAYWYVIVNEIRRVALMGRSWIEEHRAKNFGFWKLLELANFELQEPRGKSRGKNRSAIKNKHFAYFLVEEPAEFPFLFAAFTEQERLPDFVKDPKEPPKDLKVYERMCIKLLERLLSNPIFSFSSGPEYNWPDLCRRILGRIEGPSSHTQILDIETERQISES